MIKNPAISQRIVLRKNKSSVGIAWCADDEATSAKAVIPPVIVGKRPSISYFLMIGAMELPKDPPGGKR